MFFRLKKSSSGQILQLLESYRDGEGRSKHRLILSFGNLALPKDIWPIVVEALENKIYGRITLPIVPYQYSSNVLEWIDLIYNQYTRKYSDNSSKINNSSQQVSSPKTPSKEKEDVIDGVIVSKVTHHTTTSLGTELLGYYAWQELDISSCLSDCGFNNSQINMAALSTINRLVDPMGEYAIATDYIHNSSLPELMNYSYSTIDLEGRLYRVSDKLLKYSQVIEKHLYKKQHIHFNFEDTIILYDLTNTHFEGTCENNPKAKRGKNKQKRNDCPQIVIGIMYNSLGFEVGHKIFEGNQSDSTSLKIMLKELDELKNKKSQQLSLALEPTLVILDGGIATKGNLQYLRENNYDYLVNDSRQQRKKHYDDFIEEKGFVDISTTDNKNKVRVKMLSEHYESDKKSSPYDEAVLLCYSEGRRLKETAILSNAEERFLTALEKLKKRIKAGRLKDETKILKQIGKLASQHKRVNKYYTVEYNKKTGLTWVSNDKQREEADELMGCYVLRTSVLDMKSESLWHLYMTLTRAEEGFKILKHNLGLRPNGHHKEDRVDGHVFITIIAYHLLKFLLYKLELTGLIKNWESIRRLMRTHSYATVKLPTKEGLIHEIRKPGEPDERQKDIYRRLGINWQNLPEKREVIKMKT